jgi:hypothetical protein
MEVFVVALLRVAATDRGADRLDDHDLASAELSFAVCHQSSSVLEVIPHHKI